MQWLPWFRRRDKNTQTIKEQIPPEDEFLWVEGRRHIKGQPYLMPADQQEYNRLDFQHYLIRYAMQCNYIAPLDNPRGILDVGCGTGRWAHEIANAFPQAKVFGLDINTIETKTEEAIPRNYRFVKGNVLEELPFPEMTFDFVHQRFLHVAIPFKKWPYVVSELLRVTRRGGWIELAESDQIIQRAGPAVAQLAQWGTQLSKQRGIDTQICSRLPLLLESAGVVNISSYRIDLPLGNWAGRIGNMTATDIFTYNRAIKPLMVKQLGIHPDTYDRLSEAMRQEWETYHSFFSFYVTCGQRT